MGTEKIIRQQYRVSGADSEAITIKIGGQSYQLADICETGVSVHLDMEDIFYAVGESVKLDLIIQGRKHRFEGTIVHITPELSEKYRHCGIRFNNIEKAPKEAKALGSYLAEQRKRLFAK